MRISTNTIFESGSARLSELQSALMKTQQQISANRRILTPSDDPVAAARALEVTQGQSLNAQYRTNRGYATDLLKQEEGVLQNVTTLIQDVQSQVVEAGNGGYDDTQRKYIAADLRGRLEELIGYSNIRDSLGDYMFSGFQTTTQAFSTTATGVQYLGDQGQRNLQVGAARQMAVSDSGEAVFGAVPSAATYASSAAAGNTGNARVSSMSVYDPSLLITPQPDYEIVFSNGGNDYTVNDVTNGMTVASGTYSTPQTIDFNGVRVRFTGAPADGDTFSVAPSSTQSVFKTLDDLIALLETPTASSTTSMTYGLAVASDYLSSALDNVLTVRASVGARLKELETLDIAGDNRDLQYASTLSKLQDLDLYKAYSDLALQKTTLEAAQQSYMKITNLSLFNYL